MNTKHIGRLLAAALILLSLLSLFSACAGEKQPAYEADLTERVTEEPDITWCPGSHDKLIICTYDRETGVYDEPEVFYHLLYSSSHTNDTGMEIDGTSFFDLLPDHREELPIISVSACEIDYKMPDMCSAYIKAADVYLTLPSGEIMFVNFKTLDEAISYASDHFDDIDPAPVIDVIMSYSNRYVKERGYERGEEGYAFILVP